MLCTVAFRGRCNILALLSIVFLSYSNYYFPTGQVIYIFFSRVFIRIFSLFTVSLFKLASKPVGSNCALSRRTYPGSVQFLPIIPTYHSGGISVSRVCYGFLYFAQLPSLLLLHSFSICLSFFLVKLVSRRVNRYIVRCLKYIASLVPARSVLWRNSDNIV